MAAAPLLVAIAVVVLQVVQGGDALSMDYYDDKCPWAEPAGLLRMHFHDCFVRGCDGSVLLDSTANATAEKDGPPNVSLHSFFVIDNAKQAVEALCPGVVSCADILAFAARDAVALSGGPSWVVPVGRRDGRVSLVSETSTLPGPRATFEQLKQAFHDRGLSTKDLVVLSGGHTLGFAHCSSFQDRIHINSNNGDQVAPSLNPSFAVPAPPPTPSGAPASGSTPPPPPSIIPTTGCCRPGGACCPPTRRCSRTPRRAPSSRSTPRHRRPSSGPSPSPCSGWARSTEETRSEQTAGASTLDGTLLFLGSREG